MDHYLGENPLKWGAKSGFGNHLVQIPHPEKVEVLGILLLLSLIEWKNEALSHVIVTLRDALKQITSIIWQSCFQGPV